MSFSSRFAVIKRDPQYCRGSRHVTVRGNTVVPVWATKGDALGGSCRWFELREVSTSFLLLFLLLLRVALLALLALLLLARLLQQQVERLLIEASVS